MCTMPVPSLVVTKSATVTDRQPSLGSSGTTYVERPLVVQPAQLVDGDVAQDRGALAEHGLDQIGGQDDGRRASSGRLRART